ncbi:MAG: hypothetical protein ACKO38_20085 [Planctomycetota bacterium]
MSKAQFDLLHGLSNDGSFQLAIERLFELSVPGNHGGSTPARLGRWLLGGLLLAAAVGSVAFVGWKIWSHLFR